MASTSINFILRKRERQAITPWTEKKDTSYQRNNSGVGAPLTTYYANAHIFSSYTKRDETAAVGKFYENTRKDK